MKEKHTTFMLKLVVHFLIKNIPGCTLHLTFFVIMIAVVRGWGAEVECPTVWKIQNLMITLRSPTHVWSQKKELQVLKDNMHTINNHNSKKERNSTGYSDCDLVVCGFSEQIAFFCRRVPAFKQIITGLQVVRTV